MSTAFGLCSRARILPGYVAALFAVATLAGCMIPEQQKPQASATDATEQTEQYQLADAEAGDSLTMEGDTAHADASEGAEIPASLEARIQQYVKHYAQEQAASREESPDAALDRRSVANRYADISAAPPAARVTGQQVASPGEHDTPLMPGGSGPIYDRPEEMVGKSTRPARPAREQAPPMLLSVAVEPDLLQHESSVETPPAAGPAEPNRGAEVAVTTSPNDIQVLIEGLEKKVAEDPNDLDAQIRLRLLYIARGEDQKASTAPEGLAEETAALIKTLAETIIHTRDASADLNLGADRALATARTLTHELGRFAQLNIPRVVLARRVDSFGVYNPFDPPSFVTGSPICAVVYTELENFHSQPAEEGEYETRLTQRMELLDESGQRVWEREDQDITDVSRNRRDDFFLAPIVRVPGELSPGNYTLRVEVEDCLSGKFTSATVPLNVVGAGGEQRLSAQQVPRRLP